MANAEVLEMHNVNGREEFGGRALNVENDAPTLRENGKISVSAFFVGSNYYYYYYYYYYK